MFIFTNIAIRGLGKESPNSRTFLVCVRGGGGRGGRGGDLVPRVLDI